MRAGGGDEQTSRRMRVTSINGSNRTGDDDSGERQLVLVDIRLPNFEGTFAMADDDVLYPEAVP